MRKDPFKTKLKSLCCKVVNCTTQNFNICAASASYICYVCVHMCTGTYLLNYSCIGLWLMLIIMICVISICMISACSLPCQLANIYWLNLAEKLQNLQTTKITSSHMESNRTCALAFITSKNHDIGKGTYVY